MSYQNILEDALGEKLFLREPLSRHTTFRVGGPAKFFYLATNEEEFLQAIRIARKLAIPFYILGGGSNLIFPDHGFSGLIIKYQYSQIEIQRVLGSEVVYIYASAGTPTGTVLHRALKENLSGIEFLAGIPGTIGGAVVANAHAFFLGGFLETPKTFIEVIDKICIFTPEGDVQTVSPGRYTWEITGSNVKETGDIILGVFIRLKEGVSLDAKRYLKEYEEFRRDKPYTKFPSAGSIFRNYIFKDEEERNSVQTVGACHGMPLQRVQTFLNRGILSAGWLIDVCGLLGQRIGDAQISPEHGNFIVNLGKATASDIFSLIDLCKKSVYDKFGIKLELEVRIVK